MARILGRIFKSMPVKISTLQRRYSKKNINLRDLINVQKNKYKNA